ncbi:MAG: hypothetical protein IJV35_00325 [Neisseriaceae bacterium]|nr:hypothetical protein [Neisseriaceae bacterium]
MITVDYIFFRQPKNTAFSVCFVRDKKPFRQPEKSVGNKLPTLRRYANKSCSLGVSGVVCALTACKYK